VRYYHNEEYGAGFAVIDSKQQSYIEHVNGGSDSLFDSIANGVIVQHNEYIVGVFFWSQWTTGTGEGSSKCHIVTMARSVPSLSGSEQVNIVMMDSLCVILFHIRTMYFVCQCNSERMRIAYMY
jgi:hypothetical protein